MINTEQYGRSQAEIIEFNFTEKKEEVKGETQQQKIVCLKGVSQLVLPVQVLDDVTLLRRQVKLFSRTLMVLSRKHYEQEDMIEKMSEELKEVREERSRIQLQNTNLVQQLEKIKKIQHTIHEQVSFREQLMTEQREEQKSIILEQQQRIIKELDQMNKVQGKDLLEKDQKIKNMQKFIFHNVKTIQADYKQMQVKLIEYERQNKYLKQQNERLNYQISTIQSDHRLLQFTIQALERQLKEKKQTSRKIQEHIELVNLSKTKISENQHSNRQISKRQLDELNEKNQLLLSQNSSLSSQCQELKKRISNLTGNEKEIQHAVIDRFLEVLNCYLDKLQEGGKGISIKANLDMKKEAFIKRMTKEYQKFLQKMSIK